MINNKEILERVKFLNSTITIRKAVESDGDIFVDLFNSYYKRKTTIHYFIWQFFESPYKSAIYLAFDKDLLIGFCGIKIYPLTNGLSTGFVIDFLIDEAYRKRGLAFLIDEHILNFCLDNNVACLSALPNNFGNAALKSLGFKTLSKIDTLFLDTSKWCCSAYNISEPASLISEIVEFKKDDKFRGWRFDKNPLYAYIKVSLSDCCFAITKIYKDSVSNESFGDIVDMQFVSLKDALSLIHKVIEEMSKYSVTVITTWALPHTHLYKCLINNGFVEKEQERYFCLKPLNPEFERLKSIELWNLVEADAEIF